jgi:hypothetical protein
MMKYKGGTTMKKYLLLKIIVLGLILSLILPLASACALSAEQISAQTLNGYIMDEHCFMKKPDPGSDTKKCLQMAGCAASGFGIAVKQEDGTYKFYYFDGNFAPDATDSQLKSIDLIAKTEKTDHIYITVTGKITGEIKKASDGCEFQLIKVESIMESNE